MNSSEQPSPLRRRAASGHALLGAITDTVRGLRWLMAGLAGIYLASGITRVGPEEDALIFRLGRLQPEVHPPGLLFALPAPFDRVERVPTRRQHELLLHAWSTDEESAAAIAAQQPANVTAATTTPAPANAPASNGATPLLLALTSPASVGSAATSTVARGLHPVFDGYTLTGDVNLVQGRFTLRYRIVDPRQWISAGTPENNAALLEGVTFAAAAEALAGTKIDDALGAGLDGFRQRVRTAAQQRAGRLALGVELVAFETNTLTPPLAATGAFAAVTSAQVEARTALEQVRTHRAQTQPRAAAEAYALRQQADATAHQLVARAQGEAASFSVLLAEYRSAPELVRVRLRAETLDAVLAKVRSRTVLPESPDPVNFFVREAK